MICTRADLLVYLGKGTTATNQDLGLIQLVHRQVENAVRKYLRYNPEQTTYTSEYHPRRSPFPDAQAMGGTKHGPLVIHLSNRPVRSITEIREDTNGNFGQESGSFAAATALTSGSDYFLEIDEGGVCRTGAVRRSNGSRWPVALGSVRVDYVAGYSADELRGDVSDHSNDASDIMLAVQVAAAYWMSKTDHLQEGKVGAITGERLGDYSYSVDASTMADPDKLPDEAKGLLKPYRRVMTI